ncbi:Ribonuclease H-like domain containing protein, partial [Amanita muscaria]
CFPHIVNLACKATLAAITDLNYVDDTVEAYRDYEPKHYGKDCIATIRSLVNSIRNSNIKKQRFSEYVHEHFPQDYQLLRDVATRWSSTLLMINRVLKLKDAIEDITHDNEFKDLHKFQLSEGDWELLNDYQQVLQVPHAFQDVLGAETTPTLCYSIPAYSAFINMWEDLKDDHIEWEHIIQPGLDKIEEYQARLIDTPAYVVAMGETSIFQ